jgi:hypothetical protein
MRPSLLVTARSWRRAGRRPPTAIFHGFTCRFHDFTNGFESGYFNRGSGGLNSGAFNSGSGGFNAGFFNYGGFGSNSGIGNSGGLSSGGVNHSNRQSGFFED